ncbi:MAG: nitrous oxide reductase accessory protein NosL [Planctomycetes bacterium]|nr:nitrous oxide reductase accessory protein NosL [Planctomycetota bacterium]
MSGKLGSAPCLRRACPKNPFGHSFEDTGPAAKAPCCVGPPRLISPPNKASSARLAWRLFARPRASKRLSGQALIALALAGCLGDGGDRPPAIRLGEEACARCRMIINEERFAAALASEGGETIKFDDLGCLILYQREHPAPVKRYWVSGYKSPKWLDARDAYFVSSRELTTPMGYGIAAAPGPQEAEALAVELRGKVLRFEELAAVVDAMIPGSLKTTTPVQIKTVDLKK